MIFAEDRVGRRGRARPSHHAENAKASPGGETLVLSPDRIKPFILHEDLHLRHAAVDYFYESYSRDPEVPAAILDAVARYGDEGPLHKILPMLRRFAVNSTTLDRALDLIPTLEDEYTLAGTWNFVLSGPIDLLEAKQGRILEHPSITPELAGRLRRKLAMRDWSGEQLWEELQHFARSSADKQYVGEIDHEYAEDIIRLLAPHSVPDAETLRKVIRLNEVDEADWLGIFVVDLAGERKLAEAIPDLISLYRIDTDFLLERATAALVKIGDPEAVRRIAAAYPTEGENFRIYATGPLSGIKHEASVDACLALLELDENEESRAVIGKALCSQYSERAIPAIEKVIEAGYDSSYTSLEGDLLDLADILGIELPQAEAWRKERDEDEKAIAGRIRAMEQDLGGGDFSGGSWANDPGSSWGNATGASWANTLELPGPEPFVPAPVAPIKHDGPRIGRNDPCPCGSGKKYKKCHGRSG